MRQSALFSITRREAPAGEESLNAILLQRGGYIDKTMAGVYSFLPLGLRVLKKAMHIVRQEMDALPYTQEVLMPALQPRELWEESGRWEIYKEDMYRIPEVNGGLGPTHEEVITDLFRRIFSSYKDLPRAAYQIQTKFRKELRAKSGLLRGREFVMKDLYSFHLNEEDLLAYYDLSIQAYYKVFARAGLDAIFTEASGGLIAKFSHEFQVILPAGEDIIYLSGDGKLARNKEIVTTETDAELLEFSGGTVRTANAVEVGNIFPCNLKYSQPMSTAVLDENGNRVLVWMGCYGIGVSRLIGAVVECYGDISGKISWPTELAPFAVHLLDLTPDHQGEDLYKQLHSAGVEILYDDRGKSAGEQFADADLVGAPVRIVLSKRSLAAGGVEVTKRGEDAKVVPLADILNLLKT